MVGVLRYYFEIYGEIQLAAAEARIYVIKAFPLYHSSDDELKVLLD